MDNTAPVLDTSADATDVVEPEIATDSEKGAAEGEKVESFSDWLKRQNEPKAEKKEKVEKPSTAEEPKDIKEEKPEPKLEDKTPPKDVKAPPAPKSLKVGDVEYTPEKIQELTTSHSEMKESHTALTGKVDALVQALKSDVGSVLAKIEASDPEAFAKMMDEYVHKRYVEPAQFKALPPEAKVQHYEKQEQERATKEQADKATAAEKAQQAQAEQNRLAWDKVFRDTLTQASIPVSDWTVARMTSYMKQAFEQGLTVKPADLIPYVKQDMVAAQNSTLQGLSPEQLAATLGEETLAKLRAYETSKFKNSKFENSAKAPARVEKPKGPKKRYKNAYDLLDDLDL